MLPEKLKHILLLLFLVISCYPLFAQVEDELNLKLAESTYLQEEYEGKVSDYAPPVIFPNINKIGLYQNDKLLKQALKADASGNVREFDSLITIYISNWGIQNFFKDVEILWLAGQAREFLGDTTVAMFYYNLALKNQRPYIDKIKIQYDSLRAKTRSEWVDLKFYYKILEARREIDPLIPPKGVMLNMGPKVNGDKPDYAPFMHPSDSILVFTSRRNEDMSIEDIRPTSNEDLFYVQKNWIDGTWTYAENFDSSVNSQWNEGSACLSPDGRILYFARCDADDGFGSCDLYSAEYIGGEWTNIQNLGLNVNSNAWDSHPNISPDGKLLFFSSNRDGGFGKSDLYLTRRQDDGSWSKAENLGPVINTMDDEVTPFYHKINRTLYFSSYGHLKNVGGYDIYKSRKFGEFWEEPKNLGPLVNTPGNEYYFSIDGKGQRLFYAMSKPNDDNPEIRQNFDLYSFPMPMEARPDAIVTLKGFLIDSVSGNPLTGVILVIDRTSGVEIAPKYINEFGYFEFDLINNKHYDIYIQGENFLTIKEDLVVKNDTSFTVLTSSIQNGKPLVFESLEFEENSYDLTTTIEPKLDYIIRFMQKYPMMRLKIKGHTDSEGDAKYNLELSYKRANQIRYYMVKKGGLDESRIFAVGYGESRPLVPNDTEEHRKQNRRVEFEIEVDPAYKGEVFLPMQEELLWDEEEFFDPEFMEEEEVFEEEEFEFDWNTEEFLDEFDMDGFDDDLLKEYDDWEEGDEIYEEEDDDFGVDLEDDFE